MKKCPYCGEKIQATAIKCKHCGEWLEEKKAHVDKVTTTTTQKKRLDGFSRAGFFFSGIYLLRARQYLYFGIIVVVSFINALTINPIIKIVIALIYLALCIIVGIKGRKLAHETTKKTFEKFRNGYVLCSKILFYVGLGILALGIMLSALIPRFPGARGRANDVARKADIQQTAAALVSYQIDNGTLPTNNCSYGCSLINIKTDLLSAGMSYLPTDPSASRSFNGIANIHITNGQYGYTPIKKGGVAYAAFVLMAATETVGGSNRVADTTMGDIQSSTDYSDIVLCTTFTPSTIASNNNGYCTYNPEQDQLRYVYVY